MSRDRLWELLADRATQGLSESEARELDTLLAQHPDIDPDSMDLAAAAVDLAIAAGAEPMPASLKSRIAATLDEAPAPIAVIGRRSIAGYIGWAVAAACLAIAIGAWWPSFKPSPSLAEQRQSLLSRADTIKGPWGEWSDESVKSEVPGVRGEVIWNESEQRGFMTFTGLPAKDPSKEVYQLWIIDERGMGQRISGAIFDAAGTGEVIVPISPRIKTKNAAAFAVTIEEPGGTWVSDMKRRVVIALPKKG
jgi:hypothetical protein